MVFKLTVWAFALLFIATIVNVVAAYTGMSDTDVQAQFKTMGLLGGATISADAGSAVSDAVSIH